MPSKRKAPDPSVLLKNEPSESESGSESEQEKEHKNEEEFVTAGSGSDEASSDDEQAGKAATGYAAAYSRAFSKIMKKSVPDTSLANSLVCPPFLCATRLLKAWEIDGCTILNRSATGLYMGVRGDA